MAPFPILSHEYTVEVSDDYPQIDAIIRTPKIYRAICDDYSPAPEDYRCPRHPAITYLFVRDGNGMLMGMWMAIPLSMTRTEVHFFPLPHCWGSRAREATRTFFDWLWKIRPETNRLVANIPGSNRLALVFARSVGMSQYGLDPAAFRKGGVLYDLVCMGLTRPKEK